MTLQFLRTQSDTKNLARPRILTLNNETAEISIKTDEAIGLSSVTSSSQSTATTVAQAERVQTGVFLKVTPQADVDNGEITMAIEPRGYSGQTGQTFGASTFKDPEERGTKSPYASWMAIRLFWGTVAYQRGRNENQRTFSGRIPVLGAAFRHKNKSESQRELIIFITPHIVPEQYAQRLSSAGFPEMAYQPDIPSYRAEEINKALSRFELRDFRQAINTIQCRTA